MQSVAHHRPGLIRHYLWLIVVALATMLLWRPLIECTPSLHDSDFSQDFLGAYRLLQGRSAYQNAADEQRWFEQLGEGRNFHLPSTALLIVPIFNSDPYISYVRFKFLSALSIVATLCVLASVYRLNAALTALFIVCGSLFAPVASGVFLGQPGAFVFAAVLLGWLMYRRGAHLSAGVLWGAATLIKLYPGFLLLFFFVDRNFRAGLAFLLTLVLGVALTGAMAGVDQWVEFFAHIGPEDTRIFAGITFNASLFGALVTLRNPSLALAGQEGAIIMSDHVLEVALTITFFLGAAWRIVQKYKKADQDSAFALACASMILLAPISWSHNAGLLLFSAVLVFSRDLHDKILFCFAAILMLLPDPGAFNGMGLSAVSNLSGIWAILFYKSKFFALALWWLSEAYRCFSSTRNVSVRYDA